MFFEGNVFWFLMGMLAILVGVGFKAFADDRGWQLNWWKWLLVIVWYLIFNMSFLAWGTLIGEFEPGAGWKMGVLGLFISLILGVGLWRLLSAKPSAT
ncbi:hypothetical protein [Candidatus Leptofilum sp.]|uniref:hypothetical protein n=1 Tax=Candidatus Leptofilum sp. TaxID=3241576 RepID=UPI003B5976F1